MLFEPIKIKLVVDKRYACVQSEWVHKSKKEEVCVCIYSYSRNRVINEINGASFKFKI